jgi:hypothetical protein
MLPPDIMRANADTRLINLALIGYILLEIAVVIYVLSRVTWLGDAICKEDESGQAKNTT